MLPRYAQSAAAIGLSIILGPVISALDAYSTVELSLYNTAMSSNKWYNLVNTATPMGVVELSYLFTDKLYWSQIELMSDDYDRLIETGLSIFGKSTNIGYIIDNIQLCQECTLIFDGFDLSIKLDSKIFNFQTGIHSIEPDNFQISIKLEKINNADSGRDAAKLIADKFTNCHMCLVYGEEFSAHCLINLMRHDLSNFVKEIIKLYKLPNFAKALIMIDKMERAESIDWYSKEKFSCNYNALFTGLENHSNLTIAINDLFLLSPLMHVVLFSNCLKYKSVKGSFSRATSGNYISMYRNKKYNRLNVNIEQYLDGDVPVIELSKNVKKYIADMVISK